MKMKIYFQRTFSLLSSRNGRALVSTSLEQLTMTLHSLAISTRYSWWLVWLTRRCVAPFSLPVLKRKYLKSRQSCYCYRIIKLCYFLCSQNGNGIGKQQQRREKRRKRSLNEFELSCQFPTFPIKNHELFHLKLWLAKFSIFLIILISFVCIVVGSPVAVFSVGYCCRCGSNKMFIGKSDSNVFNLLLVACNQSVNENRLKLSVYVVCAAISSVSS